MSVVRIRRSGLSYSPILGHLIITRERCMHQVVCVRHQGRQLSACFSTPRSQHYVECRACSFATKVAGTKSHDELRFFFSPPGSPAPSRLTSACFFATKVASTNIPKPNFRSFDVTSFANHREGANKIACNRTQVFAFLMKRFVTATAMMSLEVILNA